MDATQTLDHWFTTADDALPVVTHTCRLVIVGVGVLLWFAGGKLIKAACIMGGMMLGMILGGLSMAFLDSAWTAMGFMIGLGLLGALAAWLAFRTWVAIAAALLCAAAAPAAVLIWQGAPESGPSPQESEQVEKLKEEPLSDDPDKASVQVKQRYDFFVNQLSESKQTEIKQLIEEDEPDSVAKANELIGEEILSKQGEKIKEAARRALISNLEDLKSWWSSRTTVTHQTIGLAMLIGAGVGFLLGFMAPTHAAAAQSAMVGAVLIVMPGRELLMSQAPGLGGLLPESARGTLVMLGLITLLGMVVQWTVHLRRVDKKA